jgi:hypothetical protein
VPHPAQVAGFTTLAYCADFTQQSSTNNVVNHTSGTMAWTTLSNWLDCAGASSPQWSLNNYIGKPNNCADISVANDSVAGTNVLIMTVTPGDSSPFTLGIATAQSGNYLMTFPSTNSYAEVKYRISTAQTANIANPGNVVFDYWSEYQTPCGIEVDFIETFGGATPNSNQGLTDWCNTSNHGSDGGQIGTYDSNYHLVGSLNTSNGSSGKIGQCMYIDGTATLPQGGGPAACQTMTPSNYGYTQMSSLILWNNAAPVTGDVSVWIEYMRIWSCAGWQTGTPNSPSNTCITASPFTGTPP